MVRSERTTLGFFHQLPGECPESLQECGPLVLVEARERLPERLVAPVEPGPHVLLALRVEVDDGPALVLDRLVPVDEVVLLEVAREAARRRQREPHLVRQLADRARPFSPHLDQERNVTATDRRVAVQEGREVGGRSSPAPQPAQHLAQKAPKLCNLRVRSRHCSQV